MPYKGLPCTLHACHCARETKSHDHAKYSSKCSSVATQFIYLIADQKFAEKVEISPLLAGASTSEHVLHKYAQKLYICNGAPYLAQLIFRIKTFMKLFFGRERERERVRASLAILAMLS